MKIIMANINNNVIKICVIIIICVMYENNNV
jgi:hypothetical protein